jgi:hypothetical protein
MAVFYPVGHPILYAYEFTILMKSFLSFIRFASAYFICVRRRVSKRVEDGHRQPTLKAHRV